MKKDRKKRVGLLAVTLTALLSCFAIGVTTARYYGQTAGEDTVSVAKFAFDVADDNGAFVLDLSNIKYPGTSTKYVFTVTNSKNGVSEVGQTVSAKLSLDGDLPLKITLKNATTELIVLDFVGSKEGEILSFKAGEVASQSLTLLVEWPPERNDVEYAGKSGKVSIALTAEQIAPGGIN